MIGFRVDANEHIASGHLMRCIAIAEACRQQGEEVLFLLAEKKETNRLEMRNLPYRILCSQWNALEEEEELLKQIVTEEKLDWLVVDSYQATAGYLKRLNEIIPVLYIDDMVSETYEVSAVLHYLEFPGEYAYKEKYLNSHTTVLSGLNYVPLREEFSAREECSESKSILITTGGTDPYNITGQLLMQLTELEVFSEYAFHVIVGSMNTYKKHLYDLAQQDNRIQLHENITNMSEYMKKSRFAVSAGGTTLFELCACGTPTVCFSFADNQEKLVENMEKHNIMQFAGDARREPKLIEKICDALVTYAENKESTWGYKTRMRSLVDGEGAHRIAAYLRRSREHAAKEITWNLREATKQDAKLLFDWKNDKLCVQTSLTGRAVSWEEHIVWYTSVLEANNTQIYILEVDGTPAAQIRIVPRDGYGEISYSVAEDYRGKGLGTRILLLAEQEAIKNNYKELRGEVQRFNIASRKAFLRCGYTENVKEDILIYSKKI